MHHERRKTICDSPLIAWLLLGALAAAVSVQAPAQAQDPAMPWPARPVRWIVPFPPGGATDLTARMVSQKLSERLTQPVVVDNKPGAGSLIGMEAAAKSAPDGYTILFVIPNLITSPMFTKANFDPLKDLVPVIQLTEVYMVMLANNAFPPKSVSEVIALAREKPGVVTCASGGGTSQLGCEMLRAYGKVDIANIPYKGMAPAMNDLIGGHVMLAFDAVSTAIAHVNAKRVRAIATLAAKRGVPPFGELPTVAETFPGFELVTWQGVVVPAGTPREIVSRLNGEIAAVLAHDEVHARLKEIGLQRVAGSPEDFAALIQRDYEKYSRIFRETGIKTQ